MRWKPLSLIALALVATGLLRAFDDGDGPTAARPKSVPFERHYVTPDQLTASGEWTARPAPPLTAIDQDGRAHSLAHLAADRPLVVVFIKDGCPCGPEAEPFFARLRTAYGDRLRFAGVIDGSIEVARKYATEVAASYPVLADSDAAIIRSYRVANSVYVALVRPDGVIDTLWPGYSAEMLHDLGRRVARLARTAEVPLDVRDAPTVLTTGCPF